MKAEESREDHRRGSGYNEANEAWGAEEDKRGREDVHLSGGQGE